MGISISKPASKKSVFLGQTVDFAGTVALGTARVELTLDGEFEVPTVTLDGKDWFVSNRFNMAGTRRVLARALDAQGNELGTDSVDVVVKALTVAAPGLGDLIPIPKGINKGLTRALQATMLDIFGKPCTLSTDCKAVTNARVKALLVTRDVGPFTVTGIRPAVEAIQRVLDDVRQNLPQVHKVLGTAGVLCCRRVKTKSGNATNYSNHSWGSAIDLKIKGVLDPVGDGLTQRGIALIAPHFHKEGFFWGAGFSGDREDAMHFEASDQLVRRWNAEGLLG